MKIALRLGCRVLGLTLLSVGLRSTLRPVHSQVQWAVSSLRVCKVQPSQDLEREWSGENTWSSSCGLVLLLLILVSVLLVGTLINTRRGHRYGGQRPSCSVVHFPSRGRAAGLGDGVGHCHDVAELPRVCLFISPVYLFWGNKLYSFFRSIVLGFSSLLGVQVTKWVPTPCHNDAYSVGTPKGHYGRNAGKNIVRP